MKWIKLAWLQAVVATSGSLYFSEVLGWRPCALCWYQRVLMYPLSIILLVGWLKKDKGVVAYALPLALLGLGVALYHNLLQWGIIPEQLSNCVVGVPCVSKYRGWLGFITIPLLSLTAFWVICACLVRQVKANRSGRT